MEAGLRQRLVSLRIPQAMAVLMLSPLAIGQPEGVAAADLTCTVSTFSGGSLYSGAVTSSGQLFTWGRNSEGQLGLGYSGGGTGSPTRVATSTGLTTAAGVWAGSFTTFAVDPSGEVWGWGDNSFNQRGNNTGNSSPEPVIGPTHVVSIGAGFGHTVAATADGTVWGWGSAGAFGVQPIGGFGFTDPVVVPGLTNVTKVVAGAGYSLALISSGAVFGAGANDSGQLGLGSGVVQSATFQAVPGLNGIVDIATSDAAGGLFTVVLDGNGHVVAFGSNFYGEMGNGTVSTTTPQFTPTLVSGLDSVVSVAAGNGHVLALKSDHTVWAWGENESGQLGDGGTTNSATPVQVSFPSGVQLVSVAAGLVHSMALDSNGNLWAWGHDGDGEIGNGFDPGIPVTRPTLVNLGPISSPCAPPPARSYLPSRDGYQFNNSGPFNVPTPDKLAIYYPSSTGKIYQASGGLSIVGQLFYDKLFVPTFNEGLCYGMATSDTYLFNRASPPPGTYARWAQLADPLAGDTLTPPVTTNDTTIELFIDRYHARQLAAAAAQTSVKVWASVGLDIGLSLNRAHGNLAAFDRIAAQVKSAPQVVAFGPSPFILSGGPLLVPNPNSPFPPLVPFPPANPSRFWTLFNNSHAVVAYDTLIKADGTRVIKVYDPSSASINFGQTNVIDDSRIEVAPDGSIKLIDFSDGADANGDPKVWIGGGIDSQHRDMGQPGDWILMPLPDAAFSDPVNIGGADNRHWFIPDALATAINSLAVPRDITGVPVFHISGPGSGASAMTLPAGAAYDDTITAMGTPALTAMTISGHLVTATQTDANASGSSHHIVVDPTATSIRLDSATQVETFTVELGGDYLPAFSRNISVAGLTLAPSQSLNLASDPQTSGLTISASSPGGSVVPTTFEQTGANPGQATVQVIVPASSIPASVSIFDWNNLGTSLIFEVIDAQGTPTGRVLQGNPEQRQTQISNDLSSMQSAIASIADDGLRNSLQAKVASAQNSFASGQTGSAANILRAMRNEVDAQAGKKLNDAAAATLRQLSADALILLGAG
jgi:alpha-tubulin suppressor-like RCC1 family protein